MKIIAISDTHGQHYKLNVPDGDVFIHCGDFSTSGTNFNEVVRFLRWMKKLPHKHKILVSGNHDGMLYRDNLFKDSMKDKGITYLENTSCQINGINFYGTPYTPPFFNWYFMADEDAMRRRVIIPNDTDVVISHGPPYGYLDKVKGKSQGCNVLLEQIQKGKPKYSIFGHIHEGHGQIKEKYTTFINCTMLDEKYRNKYKPVVFEY